jgi:hypothetical protein
MRGGLKLEWSFTCWAASCVHSTVDRLDLSTDHVQYSSCFAVALILYRRERRGRCLVSYDAWAPSTVPYALGRTAAVNLLLRC